MASLPWDFGRHGSGVRYGATNEKPRETEALPGLVRIGTPSIRLFLIRLRPRRAGLRFTGQHHGTKNIQFEFHGLTRSEIAVPGCPQSRLQAADAGGSGSRPVDKGDQSGVDDFRKPGCAFAFAGQDDL